MPLISLDIVFTIWMFIRFLSRRVKQRNWHVKLGLWRRKDKSRFPSQRCATAASAHQSADTIKGEVRRARKNAKQASLCAPEYFWRRIFFCFYPSSAPPFCRCGGKKAPGTQTLCSLRHPLDLWPPRPSLHESRGGGWRNPRTPNNWSRLSLGKRDPLKFNLAKVFLLKTSESASHQNCRSEREWAGAHGGTQIDERRD